MPKDILLVEDSVTMAKITKDILEKAGYNVTLAENGQDGLGKLNGYTPNLIITDVDMPLMDGYEFTRRVRASKEYNRIPIIILTSRDKVADIVQGLESGADNFLKKPYKPQELQSLVSTFFEIKEKCNLDSIGDLDGRIPNKKQIYKLLIETSNELEKTKCELEEYSKNLEQMVKDRTCELEKAYEDLKELDAVKMDIISNVSHELKTPLTIIKFCLEESLEETDDEDRNSLLKKALKNVTRQHEIINDLIEIAMVEKENVQENMDIENINLNSLVEEVLDFKDDVIKKNEINIKIAVDKKIEVYGNRSKMRRVFINILDNAIKFNQKSGVVKIEGNKVFNKILVAIEDTGIGIKKSDLARIFDPLTQLDPSASRRYEGAGNGLTVAKKIIEIHGGKIWVESWVGEGSKFYFTLPVRRKSQEILLTD